MNYRDFLQRVIYVIINPIIQAMVKVGITPNMVTTIGFVGNLAATSLFVVAALMVRSGDIAQAMEMVGWGGATILFAGLFDMMDGRLARVSGKSSVFGALWDSTLDRYSELFTLFGITVFFLLNQWEWMGVITFLAMVGSVMVSYVRARAEGLDIECKVGLMQRPERVVLTAFGAIMCGIMADVMWLAVPIAIIAVLANITAFWRIGHCYNVLKGKK